MDADLKSVCIREVQKSLSQSVKALIEDKIEKFGLWDYFEPQRDRIKLKKGTGQIIFQGLQNHTADSIKSLEGYKVAWCEEAQSLSQLSLDLLRPTIRTPGSELWFTYNPRYEDDPIDVFFRGASPPKECVLKQVNWRDNPWFPDVLRDEMEYDRDRDLDKYQHVWEGGHVQSSEARVFKNWKVDEFEAPPEAEHQLGCDFGFSIDPSVLVRCHIVGKDLFIDYEAYRIGCEIVDTPALFMTVPDSEKWPMVADSARPETISHLRKHGFPKIFKAVKGARSVEEGIEWLKSFNIVVHPRCKHVIQELTLYKYKEDPTTGRVLPLLEDKDNHCIDALRYACESARRASKVQKKHKITPKPRKTYW